MKHEGVKEIATHHRTRSIFPVPSSSVNDTSVSLLDMLTTLPKTLTCAHEFGGFQTNTKLGEAKQI